MHHCTMYSIVHGTTVVQTLWETQQHATVVVVFLLIACLCAKTAGF